MSESYATRPIIINRNEPAMSIGEYLDTLSYENVCKFIYKHDEIFKILNSSSIGRKGALEKLQKIEKVIKLWVTLLTSNNTTSC